MPADRQVPGGLMHGFIELFIRHRNAANLAMAMMILLGFFGLSKLNRQVMPTFGLDIITINVAWPGASPEDVETNVLESIEPEVRFLDGIKRTESVAFEGNGNITLVYIDGYDMSKALTDVQAAVARVTTLPQEIERPIISLVNSKDTVLNLEITGPFSEQALKTFARSMRNDLLNRGLERVEIQGMRDTEMWVEISDFVLRELGLSLEQVANRIARSSVDLPSGSFDSAAMSQQIRSENLARTPRELGEIEIKSLPSGQKIHLADIATITETFEQNSVSHRVDDNPSITLRIARAKNEDSLQAHQRVVDYLNEVQPTLPQSLEIKQYDIFAYLVSERLGMLISNGLTGLLLVLGVLYLFLSGRLAFWVAAGIPISIMATFGLMAMMGLSLNMISMFAIIMGLGIIVDDAIVVGEQIAALHSRGLSALEAVLQGSKMMFAPVMAASLTTIATFFPLLLLTGTFGQIQIELPKTMIAIIIASLIECFLILPTHLLHSLKRINTSQEPLWRQRFLSRFNYFRDNAFRRSVEFCFQRRYSVLLIAFGSLVVVSTMMATSRVGFEFFPRVENNIIMANFAFSPGTPRQQTIKMLEELERAAYAADEELRQKNPDQASNISVVINTIGSTQGRSDTLRTTGDNLGAMMIELIDSERRHVRSQTFGQAWQSKVNELAGLERLTISPRNDGGPPGRDLDIRLFGAELETLKQAASFVQNELKRIPGVLALEDNLPYGKQEVLLRLTPEGKAMGFSNESVARQVRDAFEGRIAKRYADQQEEILVRVKLPEQTLDQITLRELYIYPDNGDNPVPLSEVVKFEKSVGFSQVIRENGLREVSVLGDVDPLITTSNRVLQLFENQIAAQMQQQYPSVEFALKGKADEQSEAVSGVGVGAIVGITAVYVILAWVLASYSRPFVVMSIIPFGIVGAIVGHWLLGYNMNMFSIIGILGLSGVVINDSIILVTTIRRKEEEGFSLYEAVMESTEERLRPVLLTTLTTIGGLLPILFETSRQALLVQPLAITMIFGLLFATTIVLGFVPALLGIIDDISGGRKAEQTAQAYASVTEQQA